MYILFTLFLNLVFFRPSIGSFSPKHKDGFSCSKIFRSLVTGWIKNPEKEMPSTVGSLTVETALVLPIFMFAMLSVVHLTEGVRFSSMMSAALCETSTEYAKYAYAYEKGISAGGLSGRAIGVAAAGSSVLNRLGNSYLQDAPLSGGRSGISFLRSSVLDRDETIDLVASYKLSMPYNFLGFMDIGVTDRARVRAFTGYDNTKKGAKDDEEAQELVYITETGSVYHRQRGCKHLKLNIMTTSIEDVGSKRANDGSKYYPCEYCGKKAASGNVFITNYGNRYHSSVSCPGLKRKIYTIPISEVGGRGPCSACG